MEIWEMTYKQYCEYYIENSRYKDSIKNSKSQLESTKNSCLNRWVKSLEERAEIGDIPEKVIRVYVDMFGENQLKRVFRGIKSKGLKSWEETQIKKLDRLTKKEQYAIYK